MYNDFIPTLDLELPLNTRVYKELGSHENYLSEIQLAVPIFTGGKISGGIRYANQAAQYSNQQYNTELYKELLKTRTMYFSLYKASQLVEAAQSSYERVKIINDDIQALYNEGMADSVDILEAQLARPVA